MSSCLHWEHCKSPLLGGAKSTPKTWCRLHSSCLGNLALTVYPPRVATLSLFFFFPRAPVAYARVPCLSCVGSPLFHAAGDGVAQVREWAEEQTFASCWMASFRRAIFRGGEGAKGEGEQGGMEGRSTGRLGSPEGRRADTSTASSPEQRALLIQALGCLEHQAERRQVRRQCAALEGGSSSGSAAARLPPPPSPQGTTAPKGSAPRAAPPFSTSDHDAAGAFSPLPRPRAPPSCMQLNQHWLRGAATLVQPGEQGAGEQRGVLDEANMEAVSIRRSESSMYSVASVLHGGSLAMRRSAISI